MRSAQDMAEVRDLLAVGLSARAVSERTGVPYSTVLRWKQGATARFGDAVVASPPAWRPSTPDRYAYLLGVYLGDGTVARTRRSFALTVVLDNAYPAVVDEVARAMGAVSSGHAVTRWSDPAVSDCTRLSTSWIRWPEVFPQHGPGRKHERPIVLEAWQQEVVDAEPEAFLRGLVHSDGCRTVNRFSTRLPSGRVAEYAYARYFFSNRSADIRALFCASCDRLGIRWTQPNPRNVSVAHRASVARLDGFIGPKA